MRKINRIERIARREEKTIIKRIFLLSVISVVLVIVLFTVGTTALGKFADLLDVLFKNKGAGQTASNTQLLPPILDSTPQATNSAELKITGFSSDSKTVEVYKNGEKVGDSAVDGGRFSYEDLTLSDGSNEITLKAVADNGNTSDFSRAVTVVFDKKDPTLKVDSPTDGQNFSGDNRVKVTGQAEKDSQVFANGFLANVTSDGKFDVTVPLTDGENNIEVKALDDAGNTKIVKIKVNFHK